MTRYAVVRHPDVAVPGVVADSALDDHRSRGWYRVSDWADDPADLYPPAFADGEDLDAEQPDVPEDAEADPAESSEEPSE
jgi:hypothetical protein